MAILARPLRIFMLGLRSIWRHRMRSALTVLGIVFGVCSVIAMLAIGEGASYEAQEQIRRLGSHNIIINSRKPPRGENLSTQSSYVTQYGLTYKDAERIHTTLPNVEVLVPSRTISADVIYGRRRVDANVVGTVPWYPEVARRRLDRGRFLVSADMDTANNVCVLSAELARRLFATVDPLDKTLRIRGEVYQVVGVMAPVEGRPGTEDGNNIPTLYIPLSAARSRFGDVIATVTSGSRSIEKVELHQILARVDSLDAVATTAALIRQTLERFHKDEDYEIVVPLELLRQAERTKRVFNIVLGSIAAISLLVGGIGIMNIMLASVTERTREIGIRRALGARKTDILTQFLAETVVLSSLGGLIGIVIGVATPFVITYFADMATIVRAWSLIGAFAISVVIGVIFGIYPAWRAAAMNPISALRHE